MDAAGLRVAIVGVGVAGSLVAHRLARRSDIALELFEKVATAGHADSGTGLNVGPNGIAALARIDPALVTRVQAISLPWGHWSVRQADGSAVADFDMVQLAGSAGIRVRWAALYTFLRGLVASQVNFSAEATAARREENGRIALQVENGGRRDWTAPFDLVVAADGRYSMLRETLVGRPAIEHMGIAVTRLLCDDDSQGLVDDYTQWYLGHHRLFGYRVPGGALYLTATFPLAPGDPVPEALKEPEVFRRTLTPGAGRLAPGPLYVLDRLSANVERLHWARFQQAPVCYRDPGGRLLVLGDAAHPMAPTLGQGATQALEDADAAVAAIEAALDRASTERGPVDVPAITGAVERRRTARVRFVMDRSWSAAKPMLLGADQAAALADIRSPQYRRELEQVFRLPPSERPAP